MHVTYRSPPHTCAYITSGIVILARKTPKMSMISLNWFLHKSHM
jgi:hypothetical protein